MATAITFSRQNDVSRACTTQCWKNYPLSHTFMVWDQAPHQEKKKKQKSVNNGEPGGSLRKGKDTTLLTSPSFLLLFHPIFCL